LAEEKRSAKSIALELVRSGEFLTDDAGFVWRYCEPVWRRMGKAGLSALAFSVDPQSTRDRRAELVDTLGAATFREGVEWGRVGEDEVPCQNAVVNVRTGEPRPHRKDDLLEKVIPHDFVPGAKCPTWLAALEQWFPGNAGGEVTALQEFFGYVVLDHARFKKCLVLKGPGDTGKSVVLKMFKRLAGAAQCCTLPPEKMGDETARAVLFGKRLNLMGELSSEAMVSEDGFKLLVSTEEGIYVNPKYKDALSYVSTAKHIFATNNFPRITDRSEATLNRLLIVPMTRIIPADERDKHLEDRLAEEIEGILLWAIAGAARLVENRGEFSTVEAGRVMIAELRNEANPARDFIRECLYAPPIEVSATSRRPTIPLQSLAGVYNRWSGGAKKVSPKGLGKMLRAAGETTKEVHYGARCLASLVGYELIDEAIPEALEISLEDERADGPAQGFPKRGATKTGGGGPPKAGEGL
jgi:P4 family phage/plasmid primase-like protien